MAGKPALTLLHLGPGLSNALANLHNARRASTPLVNLVGERGLWLCMQICLAPGLWQGWRLRVAAARCSRGGTAGLGSQG